MHYNNVNVSSYYFESIGYIHIKEILLYEHTIYSNCLLLFPESLLDTFLHEGLIFQCHSFLPFHTGHGILVARILALFAIASSRGSHFVRTLHCDLWLLTGPALRGS